MHELYIQLFTGKCSRIGHFAKHCKSKTTESKNERRDEQKKVQSVNWQNEGNIIEVNKIKKTGLLSGSFKLNRLAVDRIRWKKRYTIQNWPIEFKIDTGSDANFIPKQFINKLNVPISNDVPCEVIDYSSNKVNVHGQVKLTCYDVEKQTNHTCVFLVVDDRFEPILGLESSVTLGLINRINVIASLLPKGVDTFITNNKEIFDGLGKIPGLCSITLKNESVPVLHYKKRLPLSLHDKLKDRLKAMSEEKIISFVDYPTDWINNLQLVEKPNGDIRICLDPRSLNACIKREHYLIPTFEDIMLCCQLCW